MDQQSPLIWPIYHADAVHYHSFLWELQYNNYSNSRRKVPFKKGNRWKFTSWRMKPLKRPVMPSSSGVWSKFWSEMTIIFIAENQLHFTYPQNLVSIMYQLNAHTWSSAKSTSFSSALFTRQQKMGFLS